MGHLFLHLVVFSVGCLLVRGNFYYPSKNLRGVSINFPRNLDTASAIKSLRSKKSTLATICVQINPGKNGEEPYYMCKGTGIGLPPNGFDFSSSDLKDAVNTATNYNYPEKYPSNYNQGYPPATKEQSTYQPIVINPAGGYSQYPAYKNAGAASPVESNPVYGSYAQSTDSPTYYNQNYQQPNSGQQVPIVQPGYQSNQDQLRDFQPPAKEPSPNTNYQTMPFDSFSKYRSQQQSPTTLDSILNQQSPSPMSPATTPTYPVKQDDRKPITQYSLEQASPINSNKNELNTPMTPNYPNLRQSLEKSYYNSHASSIYYPSSSQPTPPYYPFPIIVPSFIPFPQPSCCVSYQQQCGLQSSVNPSQTPQQTYIGSQHSEAKFTTQDSKEKKKSTTFDTDRNVPTVASTIHHQQNHDQHRYHNHKLQYEHREPSHQQPHQDQPQRVSLTPIHPSDHQKEQQHYGDSAEMHRSSPVNHEVSADNHDKPLGSPTLTAGPQDEHPKDLEPERRKTDTLMKMSQMSRNHSKSVDAKNNAAENSPLPSSEPSTGETKTVKKSTYSYVSDW